MILHIDEIKKLPTFIRLEENVGVVLRLEITYKSNKDNHYHARYYCDNGMWYVDIQRLGNVYFSLSPYEGDENDYLTGKKLIPVDFTDYEKSTGNYCFCDETYNAINHYINDHKPSTEIPY